MPTLDDAITAVEQRMAAILNDLRSGHLGDPVDAVTAAEVVSHLATRTAHVRSTFRDGVARLLNRAQALFSEPANVEAMVGLDDDKPSRLLREAMAEKLAQQPAIKQAGIPIGVLERIGFMLLQERRGDLADHLGDWVANLVDEMRSQTGPAIRDGHRKRMAEATQSSQLEETLRTLEWTVESGPSLGAVLPDCVVVAIDGEGKPGNHLVIGAKRLHAVVMAISSERLLLGKRPGFALPADFDFNEVAARLSRDFFLAQRSDEETQHLHGLIGADFGPALDESLEGAFDGFLPSRDGATRKGREGEEGALGWKSTTRLDFDVSLEGCGDESTCQTIEHLLKALVSEMAKALPLDRLDGITVSHNYPNALRAVDQGFENAPAIETVSAEVGIGVAHTVTVLRSGWSRAGSSCRTRCAPVWSQMTRWW